MNMIRSRTTGRMVLLGALAALVALVFALNRPTGRAVADETSAAPPAPEFTHREAKAWINARPLRLSALRGHVVLLDFWTFDCWNCYRSFPWLRSVEERFTQRGLVVVGVHTPEFDHERIRENVVAKVAEFELSHAVMMDNDHSYWNAMGNRYWPAYYLIDKRGRLRATFIGETHAGDARAKNVEKAIAALLEEDA